MILADSRARYGSLTADPNYAEERRPDPDLITDAWKTTAKPNGW